MEVVDLGLIGYEEAQAYQLEKLQQVAEGALEGALLFCSHPPCVTTGRSTEAEDLRGWSGPLYKTSRGGRATYHGPSQMIVYPILNLAASYSGLRTKDLHHYLKFLSEVTSEALSRYGLEASGAPKNPELFSSEDLYFTGVWSRNQKLASIGIAVKKWISYHGLALNVDADGQAFQGISPCGFSQNTMTNLQELLGYKVNREELQKFWAEAFFARLHSPA